MQRWTRGLVVLAALAVAGVSDAQAPKVPTIQDVISVKRPGAPAISPDGTLVAFTVSEANWDENAFETEIWIASADGASPRQLTSAKGSSGAPAWSPDGSRLAFASDRDGKRQVFVIDPRMGEAEKITSSEEGIGAFGWSPDGSQIAFTEAEPRTQAAKDRDKKYGEFEVVDDDHRFTHLHVIDLATRKTRRLTEGAFVVNGFDWSPDGLRIAFDHRPNGDPASAGLADISVVTVVDAAVTPLVTQPGPDAGPVWSPDGRTIAFESAMQEPFYYHSNTLIATVPAAGGAPTALSRAFDEDPSLIAWGPDGIYFAASARTWAYAYRLDPASQAVTRLGPASTSVSSAFSFTRDFSRAAFLRADARAMADVHVAPTATMEAKKVTDFGAQLADWELGTREIVTWKSTDGAEIEGVLHKPGDFKAGTKYPLLVLIHGGPTGTSRPVPLGGYVYPVAQFLARGALVLEPNYRGSAGYGEKFRSLNVRNLGVGDSWDVVSGVDALVARGLADKDRVGSMGWSQGGYISAFLTTHDSARFKAISVGAGISNWMTYYVNTDIHPFTRQYLRATPWDDPEIYAKTSPMTYIKQARTPTLIQHGERDQRVPPPNAYELYQGLQDQNVPVKLVIYKGFGHGLNKPKAQLAAQEHNYEWFGRYLWGDAEPTTSGAR
jgi:dipeptidyl aminopeptidase/acylaminoacyl peptidase